MNTDFLVLAGRIRQEADELTNVIARAERASRVARKGHEDSVGTFASFLERTGRE